MLVVEDEQDQLNVSVYSELSLADFQEFEAAVNNELKRAPKIKLLLNLTKMSGYTLDVMWEDIQFTRRHAHDFKRIAVVAGGPWVTWLGWLPTAFTDAEIEHFDDVTAAHAWLRDH